MFKEDTLATAIALVAFVIALFIVTTFLSYFHTYMKKEIIYINSKCFEKTKREECLK